MYKYKLHKRVVHSEPICSDLPWSPVQQIKYTYSRCTINKIHINKSIYKKSLLL